MLFLTLVFSFLSSSQKQSDVSTGKLLCNIENKILYQMISWSVLTESKNKWWGAKGVELYMARVRFFIPLKLYNTHMGIKLPWYGNQMEAEEKLRNYFKKFIIALVKQELHCNVIFLWLGGLCFFQITSYTTLIILLIKVFFEYIKSILFKSLDFFLN